MVLTKLDFLEKIMEGHQKECPMRMGLPCEKCDKAEEIRNKELNKTNGN